MAGAGSDLAEEITTLITKHDSAYYKAKGVEKSQFPFNFDMGEILETHTVYIHKSLNLGRKFA